MSQEILTQDAFLNQQYELGGRRIDPLAGQITAGQKSTHLRRKPLEVLAILAAAEGRIVPRQAIIDQAWEGNNPVGEAGLNGAMWELRKALMDTDETHPLIRTIPRKGYQLGLPAQILRGPQPASFVNGAEISGKPGWRLVRKLNETSMNQSWLAEGPDQATRVFRFCLNEQHLRQLKRETTLLRLVREGLAQRMDVVKILDWQLSDPPYFIEMAATSGQNMLELSHAVGGLSNYSLDERLRWMAKLAYAVSAVHTLGVVHRNLAAASVWLKPQTSQSSRLPGQTDDYSVVLGEFGLGQVADPSALHDANITAQGLTDSGNLISAHRMYLAPEILQGQAATAASDVYALGVLIYQLISGDFEVAPKLGWERPIPSEGLKRIIGKCLESNPAARPDAATLATQLHAIDARVPTQLSPIEQESPEAGQKPQAVQEPKRGELVRGKMLGSYRLLEKIGQGGMGTVYLAEQREPVQRLVAVKLILEGMDTAKVLARFEAERQALAMMSHSNIAAVYEAGSTDEARPYFAMEYVPGKDIIEHCDEHAFDVRQRIELFLQVCDGVLHAHQKGIIHRDLKPSNILIKDAQGQPATAKIIDFGVAKSLQRRLVDASAHTQIGSFVGTMTYSSPEQIFGNPNAIDTRSDIYSLGIVLYELLTGVPPYEADDLARKSPLELSKLLKSSDPPPPLSRFSSLDDAAKMQLADRRHISVQQLKRTLGSDLSWIIAKCIEREPNERYASTLELEKDLRRWLENRPVEARPATFTYRLRKLVRRNRGSVLISAAVAITLVIVTAAAIVGFVQADRALATANAAISEADAAADFQVKQLGAIDPSAMGTALREMMHGALRTADSKAGVSETEISKSLVQLDQLLERVNFTDLSLEQLNRFFFAPALTTIEKDLPSHPALQARLWQSTADMQRELGLFEPALAAANLALKRRLQLFGPTHPATLDSLVARGQIQSQLRHRPKAKQDLTEAVAALRVQRGDRDIKTLKALQALSVVVYGERGSDAAEALKHEVLDGLRTTLGAEDPLTLAAMSELGELKMEQGNLDEAKVLLENSLATQRRVLGNENIYTLETINSLANLHYLRKDNDQAELFFREGVQGSRKLHGNTHGVTVDRLNNLAVFYGSIGKLEESEKIYREALSNARDKDLNLQIQANLSTNLLQLGKINEAMALLSQALDTSEKLHGSEHPDTTNAIFRLATVQREAGKLAAAESSFRRVWEIRRRVLGVEHLDTLRALEGLAYVEQLQGNLAAAAAHQQEVLEHMRVTLGKEHIFTLQAQGHWAELLQARGERDAAEKVFAATVEAQARISGPTKSATIYTTSKYSGLLREMGRLPEAARLGKVATDAAIEALFRNDHRLAFIYTDYAKTLIAQGQNSEAQRYLTEAWGILQRAVGVDPRYYLDAAQSFVALYQGMEGNKDQASKIQKWMLIVEQWQRELAARRNSAMPQVRHELAPTAEPKVEEL